MFILASTRNKSTIIIMSLVVLIVVGTGIVYATPTGLNNHSFEIGDTSGWQTYIPNGGWIQVVTSGGNKTATDGSRFALLKTNGPDSYTTVYQTFSVSSGAKITGYAFFKANDYLPYNDNAQVYIKSGNTVIATLFSASVAQVGNYGETPWTAWEYTFSSAGTYTVEARIANVGDTILDSLMGLDGVIVHYVVPLQTPGYINDDGHGVIPVSIISNADFDATQVNPSSVTLDGQAVRVAGKSNKKQAHIEDVNGDGLDDLTLHIEDKDRSTPSGSTEATLKGETFDGSIQIYGTIALCLKS